MARKTKEEAEKTKDAILEAAFEIFTRKGVARATLNDIAKEAGVTRGAIYWHFKDKVEVFLALARRIDDETGLNLEEITQLRAESLNEIRQLLLNYVNLLESNERYRSFYEMVNYGTEWTEELEPVLRKNREELSLVKLSLERDFAHLIDKGEIRADVEPRLAALGIMALVTGLIEIWLLDQTALTLSKDTPPILDGYLAGLVN